MTTQIPRIGGAPGAGLTDAITVKLSKPLEGHQGIIHEIKLKSPTFGDWIECGDMHRASLVKPGADGAERVLLDLDHAAVARWFQRLSGQPMAVLAQLAYEDGKVIMGHVDRLVGATTRGNA